MEEKIKDKMNFYIRLSKYFPKNQFFFGFIIIMKILPLFIITHDWNISYKKGISYWIRKLILCEFLYSLNEYYFYYVILMILFILILIINISFYFFYLIYHRKNLEKIISTLFFYIFYAFNQIIYSIISEILFNKKKQELNYILSIITIIISLITIILIFYSNINLCTIFLHNPLFIRNNSLIINPLNQIDYSTALLSIIQGFIQLEFHLKFKYNVFIKSIIRGIFCVYYIKDFLTFNKYYYRFYLEYSKRMFLSFCFFSCIIEWCFYYDYNNELIILQKEIGIILLKCFLEFFFSIILTTLYFQIHNQIIFKKVVNFNLKNLKSFDYNMVNFFNMIYYGDRINLLEKILIEFNNKLEIINHKPKCENKNCFICYFYSYHQFLIELEYFINKQKNKEYVNLHSDFPQLYKFLYNEISSLYDSIKPGNRNKIIPKLFIVITFYLIFEKNEIKCLYLIEKANSADKKIKKEFFFLYQMNFLIYHILCYHKGKGNYKLMNLSSNNNNISKILSVEKLIKTSLSNIKKIMTTFNNENVEFKLFSNLIFNFNKENKNLIFKIKYLIESSKCNIPYSEDKFTTYFKYIYGEIPNKLKSNIKNFFSLQNSTLIKIFMKDTYLLLFQVYFNVKDINFVVKYASPDLIMKLRFSSNEFKQLDIKNLFAKTFYKSYKYIISHFLRNGKDIITIENFCLLDKDKYVILFDVEATSLYTTNGMVLFLKLKPTKEQQLIKDKKIKKKYNNNDFSNLCGSCLIFTNMNGRIVSLSRGFEDFFHLKYHILRDNHLNVKDIFQIDKLNKKGNFTELIVNIYNNIINIFNEKIGLIGEDDFSKAILEIKDIKLGLIHAGISFHVKINYEKRSMRRDLHKFKIYYLFMINVSLVEENNYHNNLLSSDVNSTFISNSNFNSKIDDSSINFNLLNENINAPRNVIEKILHTTLNQKILYSNRLSYFILRKFFNTERK